MELHEYARCDAIGLRDAIRAGDVSAVEVEAVARHAIDVANAKVNGLAEPLYSAALDHSADGPFAGVPFLIKDSGPMAEGVEFFIGCRGLRGLRAQHDHHLMRRFRAAGLATLGLTAMPELGLSFVTEPVRTGPVRNPWNLDLGVGGSSGGAAALVAAGAVPVAHANDSAGSIRIPASCCGLVGLKPSRGRTPCGPDSAEPAFGAAYEFALTRTVRDAAHLLDAVAGQEAGDKYMAPPPPRPYAEELRPPRGRLRVAVTTEAWSGAAVDAEVAAVTLAAGRMLAELGHEVTEASPTLNWDDVIQAMKAAAVALAAPLLLAPRRPNPASMEAVSLQILAEADATSAMELMRMLNGHNRVGRAVGPFFTEYDLLVTPTLGQLPLPHGTLSSDRPGYTLDSWLRTLFEHGPFTAVFNISGQPAVSLPLGESVSGVPIGVQFVAPYGREDLLFQIGTLLTEAMPWKDRIPSVFVGGPGAPAAR